MPAELAGPQLGCTTMGREVTGACLDRPSDVPPRDELGTYIGTYQPFVYVPIGLAARAGQGAEGAVRLGRAGALALSLGLLILAVWLLWDPRSPATSLAGFVAAVTPMVVFTASVLSPSGPEIAAAVCFAAALLRIARAETAPGWVWAAAGAAGVTLALARALGPAFVLLLLVTVALLVGPRVALERARRGGRPAFVAGAAVVAASALSTWWEFTYQPRPSPSGQSLVDALGPSLENLPTIFRHAVGVFGALDAEMPTVGYLLWAALLLALLGAAVDVGSRRDRLTLGGLAAGTLVVVLGMSLVYREIGPLQGRYALPFLVLLPLWAGEVLHRGRERLARVTMRRLTLGLFATAATVHLLGWYANAQRFAVGEAGSWLYPLDSDWSPPLGWLPWLVLAAAGAASWLFAASTSSAPPITPTPVVNISIMDSKSSSST